VDFVSPPIKFHTTFDFSIAVPCNFNTEISVFVGGKEVKISPATFNLGPVSQGSNSCIAGAASDAQLAGWASPFPDGQKLTLGTQIFGFSAMFSCGMFTLLGILVTAVSALLTLFESWELFTFLLEWV
jgi:hypothetical protein